ncbi:MAG: sensor histidine kinase [Bacteroidota bacterium]
MIILRFLPCFLAGGLALVVAFTPIVHAQSDRTDTFQAEPRDSIEVRDVDELAAAAPFGSFDAFAAWYGEHKGPHLPEVGLAPATGPEDEAAYFFAVGADSSVWMQAPDGSTAQLDAFATWQIGESVSSRLSFDARELEGVGYGYENGQLFLYLTAVTPLLWAIAVAGILMIAALWGVRKLWIGLQVARAQGKRLAESRRRLADSREAERLRLAQDLHDGPLQDLQALRMHLGMATRQALQLGATGSTSEPLAESVSTVQSELARVARELREISEGLRPPVLGSFGLAPAVRALAHRFQTLHPGVALTLDFEDEGAELPEAPRLALYRIAQESVANAYKHGRPSHVHVHYVDTPGDGAFLTIEDDGEGFEVPRSLDAFEVDGHLGLSGMTERAESVGGTLYVVSQPGRTQIRAHVPSSVLPSLETSPPT